MNIFADMQILVVREPVCEDSIFNGRQYASEFSLYGDHVHAADSVMEALVLVRAQKYDLIIVHWKTKIPAEMLGFVQALRKLYSPEETVVIMQLHPGQYKSAHEAARNAGVSNCIYQSTRRDLVNAYVPAHFGRWRDISYAF